MGNFNMVSTRAVMRFANGAGEVATVSIPRASFTANAMDVQLTMDRLLASPAFRIRNIGVPSTAVSAKLVQTERRVVVG